jgi:hypothetical protein
MRARQDLNIDTRTATEYGVVRTFFDATFSWTTGGYQGTGSGFGGTAYTGTLGLNTAGASPALVGSSINPTDGGTSGGSLGVYYAFIQFAGFTMGKAVSQFDAPWTNYPGNNFDGLVGGSGTVTGVNQFTYTADFGQGVTAAISAQDQVGYYTTAVANLSVPGSINLAAATFGANDIGGTRAPDIVGMVRVDQAWGLFQASVALHDNHAAYYVAGVETSGHPDDKWGWAAQLALSIKNIPTGAGDTLNIQGVYTNGASRYNFQDLMATNYVMYGGTGLLGAYQSVGVGAVTDSTFVTGGQQELTTTYGFRGGYTHNWDPYWNTGVYGAWAAVRYNGNAKANICAVIGPLISTGVAGCTPDFNYAAVGVITRWTPVKNLTFSADLAYTMLDQKFAGGTTFVQAANAVAIGKPAAVYEVKDQNSLVLLLRAQRNW